ncbi:hypothetical protein HZS_5887 [Henneguya salminicola]|nr:hypothetical protein HZS_5887 [Henneguya salminicola]
MYKSKYCNNIFLYLNIKFSAKKCTNYSTQN